MGGAASAQHGKKGKGKATGDELISRVSRACRETNEGTAAAKESAWAALAVDMPLLAKRVEDNPRVLMDAGPLFMTVTHFLGNTLAAAPTEVVKRFALELMLTGLKLVERFPDPPDALQPVAMAYTGIMGAMNVASAAGAVVASPHSAYSPPMRRVIAAFLPLLFTAKCLDIFRMTAFREAGAAGGLAIDASGRVDLGPQAGESPPSSQAGGGASGGGLVADALTWLCRAAAETDDPDTALACAAAFTTIARDGQEVEDPVAPEAIARHISPWAARIIANSGMLNRLKPAEVAAMRRDWLTGELSPGDLGIVFVVEDDGAGGGGGGGAVRTSYDAPAHSSRYPARGAVFMITRALQKLLGESFTQQLIEASLALVSAAPAATAGADGAPSWPSVEAGLALLTGIAFSADDNTSGRIGLSPTLQEGLLRALPVVVTLAGHANPLLSLAARSVAGTVVRQLGDAALPVLLAPAAGATDAATAGTSEGVGAGAAASAPPTALARLVEACVVSLTAPTASLDGKLVGESCNCLGRLCKGVPTVFAPHLAATVAPALLSTMVTLPVDVRHHPVRAWSKIASGTTAFTSRVGTAAAATAAATVATAATAATTADPATTLKAQVSLFVDAAIPAFIEATPSLEVQPTALKALAHSWAVVGADADAKAPAVYLNAQHAVTLVLMSLSSARGGTDDMELSDLPPGLQALFAGATKVMVAIGKHASPAVAASAAAAAKTADVLLEQAMVGEPLGCYEVASALVGKLIGKAPALWGDGLAAACEKLVTAANVNTPEGLRAAVAIISIVAEPVWPPQVAARASPLMTVAARMVQFPPPPDNLGGRALRKNWALAAALMANCDPELATGLPDLHAFVSEWVPILAAMSTEVRVAHLDRLGSGLYKVLAARPEAVMPSGVHVCAFIAQHAQRTKDPAPLRAAAAALRAAAGQSLWADWTAEPEDGGEDAKELPKPWRETLRGLAAASVGATAGSHA